ncbi:MAG: CHAD domain-containing protein [Hyphomicrobiaceae bacterium]
MAFAYRLEESFNKANRRIALEQIERARQQLSANEDTREAVHESRKCFKRVRALLRLLRHTLTKSEFKATNASFRDLGRMLAETRDLDVMSSTLDRLIENHPLMADEPIHRIRSLFSEVRASIATARPPIRKALKDLAKAKSLVDKLAVRDCKLSMLGKGLEADFSSCVQHYRIAVEERSDDAYHEWRKYVQFHRRHLSLLAAAWPDAMAVRIAHCRKLSEYLGHDHDLSVLANFVAKKQSRIGDETTVLTILNSCQHDQAKLKEKATAMGALLAAEGATALRRRVEAYWKVRSGNKRAKVAPDHKRAQASVVS